MNEPGGYLLALGVLLLAGLATDALGRHTPLPRVTLLLLFGIVAGPSGFDAIPETLLANFDLFANLALLMVGFLLGEKITPARLGAAGRGVGAVVLGEGLLTVVLVGGGLALAGLPAHVALALACIAAASAPAATFEVVTEERAAGPFTDRLLAIVALDDVLGLLLFGLGMGIVAAATSGLGLLAGGGFALREIGGAVLLGIALGVPGALLSGRLEAGEPTLVEALGLVFACGGLALTFDVSFLLAAMTMGAVVANLARHHERPFHAIEGIEWPFMIVFFAVAGARLEVHALGALGVLGAVYVACRVAGKLAGCVLGARLGGLDGCTGRWLGCALLPQAGVAMGMALIAADRMPEHGALVLSIVVGTTVLFELVGPVFTRLALRRMGEAGGVQPAGESAASGRP